MINKINILMESIPILGFGMDVTYLGVDTSKSPNSRELKIQRFPISEKTVRLS
jgi:hypothetical protein